MENLDKLECTTPYKITKLQKVYVFIKSLIGWLGALVAVVILSPIFIITSIAIKIDSKGPVFFKQQRMGKGGKEFTCIKFRSMSTDANPNLASYDFSNSTSYVTKVGNIIRKTSIDELPQLFLILSGKMSFIGYRPSLPSETLCNQERTRYNVFELKPGISGWAQIHGRDILAANPYKRSAYDNYYHVHISPILDIKIFFMTILKVFKKDDIKDGTIDVKVDAEEKVATTEDTNKDKEDTKINN